MSVSIAIVRSLTDEAIRRGVDVDRLLRRSGLAKAQLHDPSTRLAKAEFRRVLDAAAELVEVGALGLRAGSDARIALHTVGHAAMVSATLRDAVDVLVRFAPTLDSSSSFRFVMRGRRASVVFRGGDADCSTAAFGSELALATVACLIRSFVPGAAPIEARFSHAASASVDVYRDVLGCPVVFESASNGIDFDRELLDRPQLHADPALAAILCERARRTLVELDDVSQVRARVRSMVLDAPSLRGIGAEEIADNLGVGSRTLRRKLGTGGGVRSILANSKREIAQQLLLDPSIPLKEISFRLGFADPSSFHRAFKRWTGLTPLEVRRDVRLERMLGRSYASVPPETDTNEPT